MREAEEECCFNVRDREATSPSVISISRLKTRTLLSIASVTMKPEVARIPHLIQAGESKQLIVNGRPFLMLAGELQNSSLSSAEYMDTVWQKMADMNINTLLGSVTWEMIEPVEGEFDFRELDKVILGARRHGLHLVLLWFGSFKNGSSATYIVA
jgi:GH35 family endo-1,4-beta-xylanase